MLLPGPTGLTMNTKKTKVLSAHQIPLHPHQIKLGSNLRMWATFPSCESTSPPSKTPTVKYTTVSVLLAEPKQMFHSELSADKHALGGKEKVLQGQ